MQAEPTLSNVRLRAGSVRIAVRVGSGIGTTGLSWLLGDHLGSTSLTVNMSAVKTGELRYEPYGETRYSYGSTPTTFKFTGQREQVEIGLYFYQARWFDRSRMRSCKITWKRVSRC